MIDSDTLLTIGTFILLPYIINYFTKKSPAIPKKIKPRQRFDSLITFIILIYTISTTYNTLYLPRNFLNLIKGQLDSPTYILRNGFRQYMSQTYPEWTESTSQTNELILSDEWLYGKLLSTANRRLYLIHGDEAFVGCKWCTESSDYTYFNVSELSGVYAFAVFIIGFAGYLRRKNFYLVYGLMVVFGLFLLDMVRLFFDQKLDSALSDNVTHKTHHLMHVYNDVIGV